MADRPPRMIDASWFPDGTRVYVTGGRYAGEHGEVVSRKPDLRPGVVWVTLVLSGTHLVPANRLTRDDDSTPTPADPAP